MNLIIDVGNTFVKLAVFEKGDLLSDETIAVENLLKRAKEISRDFPKIDWAIVSSVIRLAKSDIDELKGLCKVHLLNHESEIPFKNFYASPKTLGVDRIALATAGFAHKPNMNTLVIDAGTCVTYDMVTCEGHYLGGAISPGLKMRYSALNEHTANLPLLAVENPDDLIGNSTESCIHSGVVNGICSEIEGIIAQYSSRFEDLTVILTGGDAQFLSKRLKNTIFAHSKFLLIGLNYLLDYNKR